MLTSIMPTVPQQVSYMLYAAKLGSHAIPTMIYLPSVPTVP